MKQLQAPEKDKISTTVVLDTNTETYDIRIWGFEKVGVINVTWSGAGGDLSLDVKASSENTESPQRFFSVLSSVVTDDDIVQITSLCAEWIRIDCTGSTWGTDTVVVDISLKSKNFA